MLASQFLETIACEEGLDVNELTQKLLQGTVVIPHNPRHRKSTLCAIGEGCSTKVNANLGTSESQLSLEYELEKMHTALTACADTLMDLSTGGDLRHIRRAILRAAPVPVGTVPVYQVGIEAQRKRGSVIDFSVEELFETIEEHADDGVDFITVHCGLTREVLERMRREKRVTDLVSRGGVFLAGWMLKHGRENPLYEHFDRLLDIARRYEITLSLGDGARPGCLADAGDRAQVQELLLLGELVEEARRQGVQVMVEGPGHVPLHEITSHIVLEKRLCHRAPFYVLGPLVTDIAAGYDHIAAAIGGAIAAWAGADFLCVVTPAEHLALPGKEELRLGVIAAKIAAHAADLAKGRPQAQNRNRLLSEARKKLDWETQAMLSLDPQVFSRYRLGEDAHAPIPCTMCGSFCAMNLLSTYLTAYPCREENISI